MLNKEFEILITDRKEWVKSSKKNKFDFDSILAGLYNDPSHFIFELLQNAEDEGAKVVRFELYEDRLDFYHDGKDFDLEDIEGVTGIGISKKKEDLTSIGKFGVGFKSVFAITESPYVYSGDYNIKIEDFVVPSIVSGDNIKNTLISLPFNHKKRSSKEVFEMVAKKLESISLKTMLFLRNIEEIEWQTPAKSGHYLRSSSGIPNFPNTKKVTVASSNLFEEFLVIDRPIDINDNKLKVEVAFKLGKDEDGRSIIIPEEDSRLIVYFPTEKETKLKFIIHGPFKTTPNRENIPLDDSENETILEEIAKLIGGSLSKIKELEYLNVNFLEILPVNKNLCFLNKIYSRVFSTVKLKLLSEDFLPTSNKEFASAKDVLLARGKDLTEFLGKDDIQFLFSKKYWLDTNITEDKTKELREYLLTECNIVEITFESFARKITEEYLKDKSDEWMIDLYGRLLDQPALWNDRPRNPGVLRGKSIIRLDNNEHVAPFDSRGKINVYLPSESSSKYKTVKRSLTKNDDSLEFFKKLGLTTPDLFAEVKEYILPKYKTVNTTKDDFYFEDFEKIIKAYETIPSHQKLDFRQDLLLTSFIFANKNCTSEYQLCKPSIVYVRNTDIEAYFDTNNSVYIVAQELYNQFDEKKLGLFLKELGVLSIPRRIEFPGYLSENEKKDLRRNSSYFGDRFVKDYSLEGVDYFLSNISLKKSTVLWKLLLERNRNPNFMNKLSFFMGEYKWYYHFGNESSAYFDAKFTKSLKQTAWLFDKEGQLKKPSEIFISDLSDDYVKDNPSVDILKEAFNFKQDIFDQLPPAEKEMLEILKEHKTTPTELRLFYLKKHEKIEDEQKPWAPEKDPNDVKGVIITTEPNQIESPNLSNQAVTDSSEEEDESQLPEDDKTEEENKLSQTDIKSIGFWGEKFVLKTLKIKYEKMGSIIETEFGFIAKRFPNDEYEIIWLNKNHNRGKGYDFVLKKNGEEIEYIEVKAKTEEDEVLIKVTGVQWEFARHLYNKNEGDKYCFYVVKNAGTDKAVINELRNPVKLWKEGKLYAHPINFKL